MPIKQDRVISIIAAAQDYQQALTRLVGYVQDATGPGAFGTAQERLDILSSQAQIIILLKDPLHSAGILEAERTYFKRNARRNIAAAKWQAKDRQERKLGIQRTKRHYDHTGLPDKRPGAPSPEAIEHGSIHVIQPGERPDLDAEIEALTGQNMAETEGLVEAEPGQEQS